MPRMPKSRVATEPPESHLQVSYGPREAMTNDNKLIEARATLAVTHVPCTTT